MNDADLMSEHQKMMEEVLLEDYGATPKGLNLPHDTPAWLKAQERRFKDGELRIDGPFTRTLPMIVGKANMTCIWSDLGKLSGYGFGVYDFSNHMREETEETMHKKSGLRLSKTVMKRDPHLIIDASDFIISPTEPLFEKEAFVDWYCDFWEPFFDESLTVEAVAEALKENKRFHSIIVNSLANHNISILTNKHFWVEVQKDLLKPPEVKAEETRKAQVSSAENWWKEQCKQNWSLDYTLKDEIRRGHFEKASESLFNRLLVKSKTVMESWVAEVGLKPVVDYLEAREAEETDVYKSISSKESEEE